MYKFVDCLVSDTFVYKPRDMISDGDLPAEDIARLLDRGMIVRVDEVFRAPEKQQAVSRKQKAAEKAVL